MMRFLAFLGSHQHRTGKNAVCRRDVRGSEKRSLPGWVSEEEVEKENTSEVKRSDRAVSMNTWYSNLKCSFRSK
jgi:hypothetical protein